MPYDFCRKVGEETVLVGRIINGRRVAFYSVHLDHDFYGKDWCLNHGMKMVCVVPNVEGTKNYEIWESHDRRLMSAFEI